MSDPEKIEALQKIIDAGKKIVFFTGAGVSTDSGIPDFRSQDGLYQMKYAYPPEEIVSHTFFFCMEIFFVKRIGGYFYGNDFRDFQPESFQTDSLDRIVSDELHFSDT